MRSEAFVPANRAAVIALARESWDRPTDDEYYAWRYGSAPTQEAALAFVGESCVATMFAIRRTYGSPDGEREVLEPFEWHAHPAWRSEGAGLRVVKHWMAGERPLLALGGTDAATRLFARLRWSRLSTGGTYVLPLHAPFLSARGRGRLFTSLFERVVRHYFTPRRDSPVVRLVRVSEPGPEALAIARAQRRFDWMRLPDVATWRWLASAPAALGRFIAFHIIVDGQVIGWSTARVYRVGGVTCGQIHECFLRDEARAHYPDAFHAVCASLARMPVDAIRCVTNCPDTIAALRGLRFRHDNDEPVFLWNGGRPVAVGSALIDAGHADRAFFPVPTSADAAESLRASAGARDASRLVGECPLPAPRDNGRFDL